MVEVIISCALLAFAQQNAPEKESRSPATWTEFYRAAAQQYKVSHPSNQAAVPLKDRPVFDWVSIEDYHGAVFAWTENGRPALVATIFSFPLQNSQQRLAVHEFASFAETAVVLDGPGGIHWSPPRLEKLEHVPDAAPPPNNANQLKLQCRRLAKEFSAHINRRGERWDLRLLPTPLVEYQEPSQEILGGGLFAFVGYTTDPEILLLVEARKTADGSAWYFLPVRFSDKSLYLKFRDKPVWESLRASHGSTGPDTEDPLYRVLTSQRLSPETVEKLSAKETKQP
jgi:hypothetical protein